MSEDRINLQFESFRGFLEACSEHVSEEGIFLATEEIRPVGSTVEFHLGIDSDFPILRGTGEVVWVIEPNGGGEVPGMAVRYQTTDPATATLVRKIAERQRARTGAAFELNRGVAGEPAAPEPAVAEASPSLATQAVDALIGDPVEPAVEDALTGGAVGAAEEAAPEPPAEPEPEEPPVPAEPEPEPLTIPPELEVEVEPEPALPVAPPEPLDEPTVKMEARPKRGPGVLWAALAVVAALAGAAYWQRDLLRETLGGAPPAPPAAADAVEPRPREPSIEAPAEPQIETPAEPVVQAPAEPDAAAAAATPEPAASAPAPSGPLTRIEGVRWRTAAGVTVLELVGDGAFPAAGFTLERLEDPPRVLLKISGVTAPLASPTVAVGSEEIVGVRTGLHGSPPESALHVVVDLADPTAEATAEASGAVLQVRVASSAISP